eukprot:EG_transcript_21064
MPLGPPQGGLHLSPSGCSPSSHGDSVDLRPGATKGPVTVEELQRRIEERQARVAKRADLQRATIQRLREADPAAEVPDSLAHLLGHQHGRWPLQHPSAAARPKPKAPSVMQLWRLPHASPHRPGTKSSRSPRGTEPYEVLEECSLPPFHIDCSGPLRTLKPRPLEPYEGFRPVPVWTVPGTGMRHIQDSTAVQALLTIHPRQPLPSLPLPTP